MSFVQHLPPHISQPPVVDLLQLTSLRYRVRPFAYLARQARVVLLGTSPHLTLGSLAEASSLPLPAIPTTFFPSSQGPFIEPFRASLKGSQLFYYS